MKVGDHLSFDIAGESMEVTVASIRKVKWDTFQPNFFIVFAPGVLENVAGTYMTSAYFTPAAGNSLAQLAHRFPSVSIFDIDELLTQVRGVLNRAALAVQSVFVFTLFAGLTVLLAAVQSSRDERRYESAMLRTLGASRATVVQGVLAEFITLGALAGLHGRGRGLDRRLLPHHALARPALQLRAAAVDRGHRRWGTARGARGLARDTARGEPAAAHDAARLSRR